MAACVDGEGAHQQQGHGEPGSPGQPPDPALYPQLANRTFGPDHVSVYLPNLAEWDAWYQAEQALKGVPGGASPETLRLYSLRETP